MTGPIIGALFSRAAWKYWLWKLVGIVIAIAANHLLLSGNVEVDVLAAAAILLTAIGDVRRTRKRLGR